MRGSVPHDQRRRGDDRLEPRSGHDGGPYVSRRTRDQEMPVSVVADEPSDEAVAQGAFAVEDDDRGRGVHPCRLGDFQSSVAKCSPHALALPSSPSRSMPAVVRTSR